LLFGVFYDGGACTENCPLLLLMGKNLFSFFAFGILFLFMWTLGRNGKQAKKNRPLPKTVAGTRRFSGEKALISSLLRQSREALKGRKPCARVARINALNRLKTMKEDGACTTTYA